MTTSLIENNNGFGGKHIHIDHHLDQMSSLKMLKVQRWLTEKLGHKVRLDDIVDAALDLYLETQQQTKVAPKWQLRMVNIETKEIEYLDPFLFTQYRHLSL